MRRLLHPAAALVFLLVCAAWAGDRSALSPGQVVRVGKEAKTSQLDEELPEVAFSAWFYRAVGEDAIVQWGATDCGERSGNPAADAGRDFPACVEATATLPDKREVVVEVTVGTWESGLLDEPRVCLISVRRGNQWRQVERLGLLPAELGRPAPDFPSPKKKKKKKRNPEKES